MKILRPTRIYTKEILRLIDKNFINAAAHITGGGLIENLLRSVPKDLTFIYRSFKDQNNKSF